MYWKNMKSIIMAVALLSVCDSYCMSPSKKTTQRQEQLVVKKINNLKIDCVRARREAATKRNTKRKGDWPPDNITP